MQYIVVLYNLPILHLIKCPKTDQKLFNTCIKTEMDVVAIRRTLKNCPNLNLLHYDYYVTSVLCISCVLSKPEYKITPTKDSRKNQNIVALNFRQILSIICLV